MKVTFLLITASVILIYGMQQGFLALVITALSSTSIKTLESLGFAIFMNDGALRTCHKSTFHPCSIRCNISIFYF